MSRGPGRWQRLLLDALAEVGECEHIPVSLSAVEALDRPLSASEYRAVNRAAWLLRRRGALHLEQVPVKGYGRVLMAWKCSKCSVNGDSEHIPAVPCFYCKVPTTERNYANYPDCGEHKTNPQDLLTMYPIERKDSITYFSVDKVIQYGDGVATLREDRTVTA